MSNLAPASLLSLLKKAATTLQYPKILYQLPSGKRAKFVLSKKYTDSVSISVGGNFYGYVRGNHVTFLSVLPEADAKAIEQLLDSEDLIATLAVHGREYVFCCFCGIQLDNASSRWHGYGPICADKYGLPWGDLPGEQAARAQKEIVPEINAEDI